VPFKVVPSTGDTPLSTFLPLLEFFLERIFCDGAQFSYRIFLNLCVCKKRLNFLNSSPTSTEGALRLLSAPSGRFWQQTAICPVSVWALVVVVRGDAFVEEHVVEELFEFGLDFLPICVVKFKAYAINTRCFMACSGSQRTKYIVSRNRLIQVFGVCGWRRGPHMVLGC
jgi:hypothetical protein